MNRLGLITYLAELQPQLLAKDESDSGVPCTPRCRALGVSKFAISAWITGLRVRGETPSRQ